MPFQKATAPIVPAETDISMGDALLTFTPAQLASLAVNGEIPITRLVTLVDENTRFRTPVTVDGQTAFAEFTVAISIKRTPVSDSEKAAVDAYESKTKAAQKQKKETEENNRKLLVTEVKREAVAETRESFNYAANVLRNLNEATAAARNLGILTGQQ